MTTEQRIENRRQLKQCFIDLGNRSMELEEPSIYALSMMIAASITEGSDELMAIWNGEFAKMRIQKMNEEDSS